MGCVLKLMYMSAVVLSSSLVLEVKRCVTGTSIIEGSLLQPPSIPTTLHG